MADNDRRIVRYEDLNLLGKVVYVSGGAAALAATLIEKAIDRAVDVVVDSERAFRQGRDRNMDDAIILDETEHSGKQR